MPGSEGLLLKWSTSSYRKPILSDLHYGKVLDFYVSTTLIKYLLRRIRSRKCTRNNWDFLYILQKSLYSTKNYIIRDLFLRVSRWIIKLILHIKKLIPVFGNKSILLSEKFPVIHHLVQSMGFQKGRVGNILHQQVYTSATRATWHQESTQQDVELTRMKL